MQTEALLTALDQDIRVSLDTLKLPGAALALIEGGEIVATRTYGYADVASAAPVTEDTRFSIQSISKSFAAWGVMTLVEDGRLDLDRPVDDYLKRWRLPPASVDRRLVTPRRLLSHHAGISTAGFPAMTADFPNVTLIDGLNGDLPSLTGDQEAYWRRWELSTDWPATIAYPPGEGWRYSNAGFGILELIVEDITGSSFARYMQTRVLDPLGLRQSTYEPRSTDNVATAYGEDGAARAQLRYLSHAAAGLYATIGDLAAFACAALGQSGTPGRGVVQSSSLATMFTPHGLADRTPEIQFETGLGHLLFANDGLLNVHHSGGSIGWRSVFSIFPAVGAGLCILVNSDGGNPLWQPVVRRWRNAIQARWTERLSLQR